MAKLFCNPLNLEYRYQRFESTGENALFREAADPTCILFKGTYLLFASMSGGFWYSDDLHTWHFKETPELPAYEYAPDVREVNGQVVFCASKHAPSPLYRSPDPLHVPFEMVSAPFDYWDPDLFCDDDGRVYLYWGSSTTEPLYACELDPETLMPIGQKHVLIGQDTENHGWERKGENNHLGVPKTERDRLVREMCGTTPWIEGVYMSKHNGTYYLQYAAPGTNFNTYCDGVYTSNSPLGPFTYQSNNPFSSVPGGYMQGAGHGSTFCDKDGNWWHISTMRISIHGAFERRLGLFPCDFDADGVMHCNQNFACFPQALPEGAHADIERIEPALMLLSKNAVAAASSAMNGHDADLGCNEDCRTWWAASREDDAPWYQIDLGEVRPISAIQVNLADEDVVAPALNKEAKKLMREQERFIFIKPQRTEYVLEGSADGETWTALHDTRGASTDLTHDFVVFDNPIDLRYLRVSGFKVAMGGVAAVSGLRAFGRMELPLPEPVTEARIGRSEDRMNIFLHWKPSDNALGYNVRYGTEPDKLYMSWQVDEGVMLDISTANAGQHYYLAIDSYNEAGVTAGTVLSVG